MTTEYFFQKYVGSELQQIIDNHKFVFHGLDLSIGSNEEINEDYLSSLEAVLNKTSPFWISDHFSYTKIGDYQTHQLMPVQFSRTSAESLVKKINIVNSRINKPFLLENITYYYQWPGSDMLEVDFYNYVFKESNTGMLLDLNNLYINSCNHNYDPYEFIDNLNLDRVVEIHLAGGELNNGLLIDTHAHSISDNVWRMLEYTLDKGNIKGVVVERDRNFEDIDTIIQDINKAKKLVAKYIVTAN